MCECLCTGYLKKIEKRINFLTVKDKCKLEKKINKVRGKNYTKKNNPGDNFKKLHF